MSRFMSSSKSSMSSSTTTAPAQEQSLDSLDRTFASYLKEIELGYGCYQKAIRIRVERWIERLCETGKNDTWKRHRNAYAKLLLNMILTSRDSSSSNPLREPFDQLPPADGVGLPPFGAHLVGVSRELKNQLGARESAFWRDIYKKVAINTSENKESAGGSSLINSSISNIDINSFDRDLELELVHDLVSSGQPVRDIQNLQILVKTQQAKVESLEQQLKDIRIKHELEIQRLRYTHKQELDSYKLLSSNPLEELLLKSNISMGNMSFNTVTKSLPSSSSSSVNIIGSADNNNNNNNKCSSTSSSSNSKTINTSDSTFYNSRSSSSIATPKSLPSYSTARVSNTDMQQSTQITGHVNDVHSDRSESHLSTSNNKSPATIKPNNSNPHASNSSSHPITSLKHTSNSSVLVPSADPQRASLSVSPESFERQTKPNAAISVSSSYNSSTFNKNNDNLLQYVAKFKADLKSLSSYSPTHN